MKEKDGDINRRQFLNSVGSATLGSVLVSSYAHAETGSTARDASQRRTYPQVPRRTLGRTGESIPIVGQGCVFDMTKHHDVLEESLNYGINCWDTATNYGRRKSQLGIGQYLAKNPDVRKKLFLISKPVDVETLPDRYPDSVDSYVRLVKAVDRKGCAAHLDPVNLINCPRRFYGNGDVIRECFAKLGPYIKSCHAKDVRREPGFPVHIQECQPGLGKLDYATYLREVSKLPVPPPLMLEHLEEAEEYRAAAEYIRSVAKDTGLAFA